MRTVEMNGFTYKISYQPGLSNSDYTQHSVYFIKSNNDIYPDAKRDIENIMNDNSWSKAVWVTNNKTNPSMANALHTYHEFSYDESRDVYVYTYVRPYDD